MRNVHKKDHMMQRMWGMRFIWGAFPNERFGVARSIEGPARIARLFGIEFGPRIFIGLVVTEREALSRRRK